MKIQVLKHVPFEGPGFIGTWARQNGHEVFTTHLYDGDSFAPVGSFDLLLVLGGPMNIYEHDRYPWLEAEKKFIATAVEAGKSVLGICLGAQLICDVLGGKVTRNRESEIGWFKVMAFENTVLPDAWQDVFPSSFSPLHWHGDTFSIPPGAVRLAHSDGCDNQAFLFSDRVLGVQFHCEADMDYVEKICAHCAKDTAGGGSFVMDVEGILAQATDRIEGVNPIMEKVLGVFEKLGG